MKQDLKRRKITLCESKDSFPINLIFPVETSTIPIPGQKSHFRDGELCPPVHHPSYSGSTEMPTSLQGSLVTDTEIEH